MKTKLTTAKMIVLSVVLSLTMNVVAFASPVEKPVKASQVDKELIASLELEDEFDALDRDLQAEGFLACLNTEIIVVLGADDSIVYQGSHEPTDVNNAFLTRLLTKADFIMCSGGKNFYKIF